MSKEAVQRVDHLHRIYCDATGIKLPSNSNREMQWVAFCKMCAELDVRPDDALLMLIRFIQKGIKQGYRFPGALKFSNLIGNTDLAQEDLAQAIACARMPSVPPGKAEVLRATGRSAEPPRPEAKKVSEILASDAFKEFVKLKEQL